MDLSLAPYRALDLTDEKGLFCGKILADLGADVVVVEPLEGNSARRIGPYFNNVPHPENSLYWWALNTGKRSISLDIKSLAGREKLKRLAATADFVLESFPPGYLDGLGLGYDALHEINPGLIFTSITPFGSSGPYRDFQTSDLVSMAMGGQMAVSGDADRPPVRISTPQAYFHGGLNAAAGCLIALHHRELTGRGQRLEISIHESVARTYTVELGTWYYSRELCGRHGPCRPRGPIMLRDIWPCADGYVTIRVMGGGRVKELRPIIDWMVKERQAGILQDIDWNNLSVFSGLGPEVELWQDLVGRFLAGHSVSEVYALALDQHVPLMPNNTVEGVLHDEQLAARRFWVTLEQPDLGRSVVYTGSPFHTLGTLRSPAPRLGEHNNEVLAKMGTPAAPESLHPKEEGTESPKQRKALEDIKIADFSWILTGPLLTKYLSDFGAQVIKVESRTRLDHSRIGTPFKDNIQGLDRAGNFHFFNEGKRSMTLNLNSPEGRGVARRLVAWADVVVENFSPGTMAKFGLGYDDLRKIRPDIIMLSASIQGQTGPHAYHPGYGWNLSGLAGFNHLTGWPDRDPVSPHIAYTDWVAPVYGVVAILAAVDYRRRTGKGQYVDLSQLETGVSFMTVPLLDYVVNGRSAQRHGNRSPEAAPHNAYPCRGDDRWCAVAVDSESRWQSLCQAMGRPKWTDDPRFVSLERRKENEEELDRLVAAWTVNMEAKEVMHLLQGIGVPAGVVQTNRYLIEDPQLRQRGFFVEVQHPEMGAALCLREPPVLEKTPSECGRAPLLGEDTEYVCRHVLGMTEVEFQELRAVHALE